jgi:hypothetical protein
MSNVPTESEQKKLDKMSKAGQVHFAILVILICLGGISFLVPEDTAPLMAVGVGVLICFVGLSTVNLQYFQKCPRCGVRIDRKQGSCVHCGLEYHVPESAKTG